jgi:inhibitor of KinA
MFRHEPPRILPASDHSLLVRFGTALGEPARVRVRQFLHALAMQPTAAIRNVHPAYASVLVSFDLAHWSLDDADAFVTQVLDSIAETGLPSARRIVLPVCYDVDFAPDLHDVAALHGISVPDVVGLHAAPEYVVHFLGFSPGFPYLGGLDARLVTPRLATPRTQVPAGSVAIGGAQTGIYPVASPGGWRIMGRTPVALFDAHLWPPAKLRMGDRICFQPVARPEFERLASQFSTLDTDGRVVGGVP